MGSSMRLPQKACDAKKASLCILSSSSIAWPMFIIFINSLEGAKWCCNSIIPFSLIKWNLFFGFVFCFKKKGPSFTVCIPRGMGVCMGTVGNTELLFSYNFSKWWASLLASSNGEQLVLQLLYGVFVSSFSLIWIFVF